MDRFLRREGWHLVNSNLLHKLQKETGTFPPTSSRGPLSQFLVPHPSVSLRPRLEHHSLNAFYIRSADNFFYMSSLSTSFSFLPTTGICLTSTNKTTRPSIQSSSLQPTGHSLCSRCHLSKISSLLLQGLWSILPNSFCPQASSKCTL